MLQECCLAGLRTLAFQCDRVEAEVGPVEARVDLDRSFHAHASGDLFGDLWRRGGGAGDQRRPPEALGHLRQAQVVRPEVVAPFGQAVGLVDRHEVDAAGRDQVEEGCGAETLRRAVGDPGLAVADRLEGGGRGLLGEARGKHDGGVTVGPQAAHLVGHQRDQGAHHERQVATSQPGQLIAEALATTGGHDDQAVARLEGGGDRLTLAGPEKLAMAHVGQQAVGLTVSLRKPAVGRLRPARSPRGPAAPVSPRPVRLRRQGAPTASTARPAPGDRSGSSGSGGGSGGRLETSPAMRSAASEADRRCSRSIWRQTDLSSSRPSSVSGSRRPCSCSEASFRLPGRPVRGRNSRDNTRDSPRRHRLAPGDRRRRVLQSENPAREGGVLGATREERDS